MAYDDIKPGLYRLEELEDYEIADEDPDVRGWEVIARNGKKIGKVDELIVDPVAMKVRYLDVDLDDDFVRQRADYTAEDGSEYHLLFPIGAAVLDRTDDNILLQDLEPQVLLTYPMYNNGDDISRDYENSVLRTLDPTATDYADDTYYQHEVYNESRFYGSKEPDTSVNAPNVPTTSIRRRVV